MAYHWHPGRSAGWRLRQIGADSDQTSECLGPLLTLNFLLAGAPILPQHSSAAPFLPARPAQHRPRKPPFGHCRLNMKRKPSNAAVILTSSALLAGCGPKNGGTGTPDGDDPGAQPPIVTTADMAKLSKDEIRKLLVRIEKAKAPEPKMGAMCYSVMSPPDRMEYVCPECGEKTLHVADVSRRWAFELDYCRRLFNELPKKEAMKLDESSFCRKCQPGGKAPSLMLEMLYNDGTNYVVPDVCADDLRLLKGFLSGKLDYSGSTDDTSALKDRLPRLRQLLGIKE